MATAYQMLGATGERSLTRLRYVAAIGALLVLFGCEMPFQTGSVRVTSTPPGARVFFDGSDTGRVTPYTIPDVSAGSHTIRLTLDGYADWGPQSEAVTANETATVNATLTPTETSGSEYGLGLELLDLQAYQSAYILRADPTISLPSSIDIGVDFPPPRSQGGQGSCVGWAVAYALKSYHERIERGWPLTDHRNVMSPAYVYNQIKLPGGGAYFTDALNLLIDQGVSSWSQMPYNQYDDRTQPSAAARAEAADYRIANWGTVQRTTHAVFVQEIKRHLAAADPVLIGVPVYPDFVSLSESNPVYDDADGATRGYHAIVIVGYDDARAAFKVINSWGTDWGIGGYGWIDYEASRSLIRSAYVAKDARPSDERPEAVSGPSPADGATGVAVDAVLRWTKNARTTSFDVYVGTDRNLGAADFQGNVAQATFAPDLAPGSKYYWRIDARGAGGVTTGPLWSFTTAGGVQPPAPVSPACGSGEPSRAAAVDRIYWTGRRHGQPPPDGRLYLIRRAHLDGSNIEQVIDSVKGILHIALDATHSAIYWSEYYDVSPSVIYTRIRCADLDGSNNQVLVSNLRGGGTIGFALDVPSGKMYWATRDWTTASDSNKTISANIHRANLDGSGVETLATLENPGFGGQQSFWPPNPQSSLIGFSLDTMSRKVYFAWSGPVTKKIQRANLDGSNVETLLVGTFYETDEGIGDADDIRGIGLDAAGGKMYWTSRSHYTIQRANLDGSKVETLITRGTLPIGRMDFAHGKMYWLGWHEHTTYLDRADLDGSNVETLTALEGASSWSNWDIIVR